ncbi:MAG TPA: sigma-70 family RNA polymerase sigma factor [Ktedonobacteraceae bacterium]|nr:sigma-70 family RNA polymerase sigma factor [Ktedonobacteraceae bacterium]
MADLEACLERFRKLEPSMRRKILKYINDCEANDILQEVQIKIIENFAVLNMETVNAWIFKVTRNLALNALKRNTREHPLSVYMRGEENIVDEIFCYDISLEVEVERAELSKLLNTWLSWLPADYSDPIRLYYLDELDFAEIGRQLGRPVNTLRSRVRRGLAKLRNSLAEKGIDSGSW